MKIGLKTDIVKLSKNTSRWKDYFNREEAKLIEILENKFEYKRIEHIGSTAINNIKAKPIIDILLVIDKNVNLDDLVNFLEKNDYKKSSFQPMQGEIIFTKGTTSDVHEYFIHAVLENYDWQRYTIFRDYLLQNPDIALGYERLKIELCKKYKSCRRKYTSEKEAFVEKILSKLRKPTLLRNKCIIIDIENTVIDVAERKYKILRAEFPELKITLEQVRNDPKLYTILGKDRCATRDRFYDIFDKPESVKTYSAPLYLNARDTITGFINSNIDIVFISSRDESFREVIITELQNNGLDINTISFLFKPSCDKILDFKLNSVKKLLLNYQILAYVGDSPEDIQSASDNDIPSIFFHTNPTQIGSHFKNEMGLHICSDWKAVESVLKMHIHTGTEIIRLREFMINKYSDWLGDIDAKIGINVTISSIIFTISGIIITSDKFLQERTISIITLILMFLVIIFSLFSLIFSIQGFTARNTSGVNSGHVIKLKLKQIISVLLGNFARANIKEIEEFNKFNRMNTIDQSRAHYSFFIRRYKTYDPDALWNHRFFSIYASNYSKLTAERWASTFTKFSICIFGIWLASICILKIITWIKFL